MKWETHRRITLEVCRYYGIPYSEIIANASTKPDESPDYHVTPTVGGYLRKVRHHAPSTPEVILVYLAEARRRFLYGEPFAETLGRALHYLQDLPIDPAEHDFLEEVLEKTPVDLSAIRSAREMSIPPHLFKRIVKAIGIRRKPDEIMWAACFLSSLAVKMVINPDVPPDVRKKYRRARILNIMAILLPWILTPLGIKFVVMAIILSFLIWLLDIFEISTLKFDYLWAGFDYSPYTAKNTTMKDIKTG